MDYKDRYVYRLNRKGTSDVDSINYSTKQTTNQLFDKSPAYVSLLLNNVDSDGIINKTISSLEKEIMFRPNTVINIGDLVTVGDKNYLITKYKDIDLFPYVTVKLCNSTLKWKDTNNNSHSYPCIIRTKNQTINEDRYISIPDADAIVTVQYNPDTATIIREQRFTFGSQVFAVDGIDDISEVINGIGIIHFQMKWSQIKASDDLTNNYADNSEINDTNTESGGSGVLF